MKSGSERLQHRPVHAPREDRSALVEPPFAEAPGLVAENLLRREQYGCDIQGRSLTDLARQARRELVTEAWRWTSAYRDVDRRSLDPNGPIFLAGHQPQLFHPGVWFKDFALGALASQQNAVAVNLIVDSDTIKESTLRVPGGSVAEPNVMAVALDRPGPTVPFEERRIADREMLADFGRRASEHIAPLVLDPLVRQFWPLVVGRMQEVDHLGACLAQARHQLEGQWGWRTLEIPQSRVCDQESFAWFACHLLAQLPRLRTVYNEVVGEYRQAHGIRSTAHPVPDLAAEGPWLEAPFWIWTTDNPQRRHLFARQRRGEIRLSDRGQLEIGLPLDPDGDASRAAEKFAGLAASGVKIRSRALITTLWARLVLSDLFVHGIGGAKYDQVTDALMARFFGLDPPGFLVLSATLLLPIARRRTTIEDLRLVESRLRELTYHPERFLGKGDSAPDSQGEAVELAATKRQWIRTPQTPDNAQTRHLEIRRVNRALQPWVEPERQRLLRRLGPIQAALRAETILSNREYSFCLYPPAMLREFFDSLLPAG